jgi:type II secretory pathway component GspD/PulD (secretin)
MAEASEASGKFRLHMVAATVAQAAEALAKASGKSIVVDPGAKKETVDANVNGVSFSTALDCICKSSGNSYSVHDSVYIITHERK